MSAPARTIARAVSSLLAGLAVLTVLNAAAWGQAGECRAPAAVQHAAENSTHVPNCSPLAYSHYPPTTGHHYDAWADPGTYNLVISPGYYLHAEEHGAVVFLINCHTPGNCQEDIARLQAIADAFPRDSLCSASDNHRIIIAGDTVMTTRFAAVAWTWSLQSDCLDTASFSAFLSAHYNHGTENICGSGTRFAGEGWCVAPMGIQAPPQSRDPKSAIGFSDPGILWRGNLGKPGKLRVEVLSLDGAMLGAYELGQAGPGPAQAEWNAAAFRRGHPAAGAVACRVRLTDASGVRLLAETLAFP